MSDNVTDPGFGDFVAADAFDLAPADPEQVARRLHGLRLRFGDDDLRIAKVLIAWLRREGSMR